jgi:cytochrome P450
LPHAIPVIDDDLFNHASVRDARAVDDRVRELAPVVRLAREDIVVMGRFRDVSAALSDWRTFSSRSRPWHDPSSVRPEILLTDDPPRHTEVRLVIANALSPRALKGMAAAFAADAEAVVDRALAEAEGGPVDAVATICRPFVYNLGEYVFLTNIKFMFTHFISVVGVHTFLFVLCMLDLFSRFSFCVFEKL